MHVAFRDTFETCPRCGTALEDAKSVRGCRSCGGALVDEAVLAEMLLEMLPAPPRAFGQLALSEAKRGDKLACPSCGAAMKPTTIHEVELDHCKKHGVWFDPDELRVALYRVARDGLPPFKEWEPIIPRFDAPRPKPSPPVEPGKPTVTFRIAQPDGTQHDVTLAHTVIKVGRVASAHLRVENDPDVSRLHAVIEVEHDKLTIIDLGSSSGTYVNEQKISRATASIGDVLRVGSTQIAIVSRAP